MKVETPAIWSRGQLESVTQCPACGSSKPARTTFERRDNEASMPDKWRMHQCTDCRSIWLDPRPDGQSLPRAYNDYYTHNAEPDDIPRNGGSGLAWRLIHGYLNRRFGMHRQPASTWGYAFFSLIEPWRLKLDYYGRHLTRDRVGPPGRLLDIGCGNGAFLARAADMGWQVQGCEIDPKAAAICRNLGINILEGDAFHPSLTTQSFNVITMSHVIEHVQDQPALLQRTHDLLRPGGSLWLALPNPQSVGLQVSGTAWHALHPPYHLSIPSLCILKNWLKNAGFSNVQPLRRGAHVRTVWRLSQAIAKRESLPAPSPAWLFICRMLADGLASFSPYQAEETVLLARKAK